jgi:hypothetical protein
VAGPPLISVVIPTIRGREGLFRQCVKDYRELTPNVEIIDVHDAPSCGIAWQTGSRVASGEYLHLSADDLEPLKGWWEAGIRAVRNRIVPASRVWRPTGKIESGVAWDRDGRDGQPAVLAQVPFCSMEDWFGGIGPMVPLQYYSDNWFQRRAEAIGLSCVLVDKYEFIHHRPQGPREGEWEQMAADRLEYERYCASGYGWTEADMDADDFALRAMVLDP